MLKVFPSLYNYNKLSIKSIVQPCIKYFLDKRLGEMITTMSLVYLLAQWSVAEADVRNEWCTLLLSVVNHFMCRTLVSWLPFGEHDGL